MTTTRCPLCGQPRPPKWRNEGGPAHVYVEHVAGLVSAERIPKAPGYPWGRVIRRTQSCDRCDRILIDGVWAQFVEPGTTLLELPERDGSPGLLTLARPGLQLTIVRCDAD